MRTPLCLAILLAAGLNAADPPRDVVEFFQDVTLALANAHPSKPTEPITASEFLNKFDSNMPDYAQLHDNVEDLVSHSQVGSIVEFVTDEGDDKKRTLEIDWVLEIQDQPARRQVLKCTIERRGKKWKIVSLAPVDFFKY
jgi:hypothetical protein